MLFLYPLFDEGLQQQIFRFKPGSIISDINPIDLSPAAGWTLKGCDWMAGYLK